MLTFEMLREACKKVSEHGGCGTSILMDPATYRVYRRLVAECVRYLPEKPAPRQLYFDDIPIQCWVGLKEDTIVMVGTGGAVSYSVSPSALATLLAVKPYEADPPVAPAS